MARRSPSSSDVHVALLRGVNVGVGNRISMPELTAIFSAAGASDVRTYIQSGNVVFRSPAPRLARLHGALQRSLQKHFGREIVVVLRSARELLALSRVNPFLARGAAPEHLHVAFLAERPAKACAAALDPARSKPDEFALEGSELYLYFPNGTARTKLGNDYLDRTLKTCSTIRNWRTVLALCELART